MHCGCNSNCAYGTGESHVRKGNSSFCCHEGCQDTLGAIFMDMCAKPGPGRCSMRQGCLAPSCCPVRHAQLVLVWRLLGSMTALILSTGGPGTFTQTAIPHHHSVACVDKCVLRSTLSCAGLLQRPASESTGRGPCLLIGSDTQLFGAAMARAGAARQEALFESCVPRLRAFTWVSS